nr:hypothetical protein [Tanacetum cinerariifolium]
MNVEGDEMDDEGANEADDTNELYRDMNINLEGPDIQMADDQTTQVIEYTHVTLTSVNPEDVTVTTTAKLPLLSATTLPSPLTPIILTLQQTPVPSPANVPSSSLQDLPNFGSLFEFDHILKALEINFSEFMQINQFAKAISLILSIVDKYLDHRMNEAMKIIKEQVKEQVKAQVSKILPKIKKIVNEKLEAEVLTRSYNSSKISHVVATNPSELELKKIFIEKMESNKIIAITELQIVEWHKYKHLDWITVPRDDDKLYKFKEGDFKRLRIQDIEDMLLLLVQGKLTNLTVDEHLAFNVSLRMFTRSIIIQRRMEDL